jgi:thymidylate synthase (FAD)
MDGHAQYEIREYANALFELIKPIIPVSCAAFEDYVLNAVTFSQKELNALKAIIEPIENASQCIENNKEYFENCFPNKREREEFINKIKKLI